MSDGEMARISLTELFIVERCSFVINGSGEVMGMKIGDALVPLKSVKCILCHKIVRTYKEIPDRFCYQCAPICLKCGAKAGNGLMDEDQCHHCYEKEILNGA